MSVLQTVRRAFRPTLAAPAPTVARVRRQCETTGCGYPATRTVADRDGLTARCEGCTHEGTAFGWWESLDTLEAVTR